MITINNLSFGYRRSAVKAISDASAQIGAGIYLLLGENGAGKTTLLHLISGLLKPEAGTCEVDGQQSFARLPETMQKLMLMPDSIEIPAPSIIRFATLHSPFYPTFSAEMFEANLAAFGLSGHENFTQQSYGNRKKAMLAYVLALRTPVILLDEPTNGLDITSRQTLQRLIIECVDPEQTLIVSTHSIADLEYLYDGVILMSHSHLLLSISTMRLTERIAFVSGQLPEAGALFSEQRYGMFHSIVPATNYSEAGKVDYTLLYNAMLSPLRDVVLNHINACSDEQR